MIANRGKFLLTSDFIWFLSTARLRFTIKFFREINDTLGNITIPFTLKSVKIKPLKSSVTFHLISQSSSISQPILLHPRAATRMSSSKVKPIISLSFLTLKDKSWSPIMIREFQGDVDLTLEIKKEKCSMPSFTLLPLLNASLHGEPPVHLTFSLSRRVILPHRGHHLPWFKFLHEIFCKQPLYLQR